jgi:anhydro-N-acetylmuramic acid kinase
MSGTSLDGIDTVLCRSTKKKFEIVSSVYLPYSKSLRTSIEQLINESFCILENLKIIENKITKLYVKSVNKLLSERSIDRKQIIAIGCHGQTIKHCPKKKYTIQLINGSKLAHETKIKCVTDFRNKDIANGGQGAPLVPAFHNFYFSNYYDTFCVVNIGGISNITFIKNKKIVSGYDTGPGNCLIDNWMQTKFNKKYDKDGKFSSKGKINNILLNKLLNNNFFKKKSPKSADKKDFYIDFTSEHLNIYKLNHYDVLTTLVELTAESLKREIRKMSNTDNVILSGGGVKNKTLVTSIKKEFPQKNIILSDALGIKYNQLEPIAFAWLAKNVIENKAVYNPTGAKSPNKMGCIYNI